MNKVNKKYGCNPLTENINDTSSKNIPNIEANIYKDDLINEFNNTQIKLNEKQLIFCNEYSKTQNATSSAILAGYNEKNAAYTGCMLMKNRFVRERISKLLKIRIEVEGITDDYLKEKLKRIIEAAVPETGEIDASLAGQAINAIKMLGAGKNMFNEKTTKDINFKIEIIDRYEEKERPKKTAEVIKQLPEVQKEVKNTLKDIVQEETA